MVYIDNLDTQPKIFSNVMRHISNKYCHSQYGIKISLMVSICTDLSLIILMLVSMLHLLSLHQHIYSTM